ncbi:uncharacterized protein LOC119175656 [Rhipicephalus microplus]|uniref:uncharacterized protein LOC119175656 n=1 Tax=Rhipicephalus microplus TaxID=6941 RepID=UPI001887F32C|nr:uncharacterized protein LOC119175656 [Rhipicephalus microplus]
MRRSQLAALLCVLATAAHGEPRSRYPRLTSYVAVLVPKHLVLASQELSEERRRVAPEQESVEVPDGSVESSRESTEEELGGRAPRGQQGLVYAHRRPAIVTSQRNTAAAGTLWIPRALREVEPPLSTTHWRGMDGYQHADKDGSAWKAGNHDGRVSVAARSRVRRAATKTLAPSSTTAAATGFIPIAGPFGGGQELAYSAFLDGGSSTPFPTGFSSYASPSRQQNSKQAYGGGFDYGRSTTSAFSAGYDSLGSGNFQLIRGGVYADNQASSSHMPYYVQGPSSGYQAYSYDEDAGGPVLGFQGFEHFGSPLHNALSKNTHVVGASTEHRRRTLTPKSPVAGEDQLRAME